MGGVGKLDMLSIELSDLVYLFLIATSISDLLCSMIKELKIFQILTSFTSIPKPNDFSGISSLPNFPYA